MKKFQRLAILLFLLLFVFVAGCSQEKLEVFKQVDFTLEDENGNPISFSDQNGKIRLITFLFTSCKTTCPATTFQMTKVQNALMEDGKWGDDYHFYTVTFDPERDTGEALKEYAKKWEMDTNHWSLVRGTVEATRDVALQFGVFVQQVEDDFIHSDLAFLIDREGYIRKIYTGSKMDTQEVLKDMEILKKEK